MPEKTTHLNYREYNIVVVIPAYRVEREIKSVLSAMPDTIRHIIVVNDASPDRTATVVREAAKKDNRIILLNHEHNQGVGGAMITGFKKALELGAQIVVKIDGDGQMGLDHIPALLDPLILGQADYTKGNRFRDFQSLSRMPIVRRVGNMGLSFMAKAATGYWNCFDPTNGFLAIRGNILSQLPLDKIHKTYFFETSMLSQLYLLGAFVKDIALPANYKGEKSNMSIWRVLLEFPFKLFYVLVRRLILENFIYNFSMLSIYLLTGIPLFLFGLIYGGYKWIHYALLNTPAPFGNIMLAVLAIMIGFQILLSAIAIDMQAVPREPICNEPLVPNTIK
jgi:dolichol-phosphate mannosyltransferase